MKKPYLLPSVILMLAALAFCAWLYPELPQRIPMHWNAQGEVDGYAPRAAIFAYSAVIAVLVALWWYALPALSPKRFPVEDFLPTYGHTCLAVVGLLAYLQCVQAWAAHSGNMAIDRVLLTGIALFFALTGNVMGKGRCNFWLGIRTPWTLASERAWYATHRFAARSMVAGAALALALLLLRVPGSACVALLIGSVALPASWSLVYYKRLERSGALED